MTHDAIRDTLWIKEWFNMTGQKVITGAEIFKLATGQSLEEFKEESRKFFEELRDQIERGEPR